MDKRYGKFTWDAGKGTDNIAKHGVDFTTAVKAFLDPQRKIFTDSTHSREESRYFCIGMAKERIMTVRFTYRDGLVRIIGAVYWRKGRDYYEKDQ